MIAWWLEPLLDRSESPCCHGLGRSFPKGQDGKVAQIENVSRPCYAGSAEHPGTALRLDIKDLVADVGHQPPRQTRVIAAVQ